MKEERSIGKGKQKIEGKEYGLIIERP